MARPRRHSGSRTRTAACAGLLLSTICSGSALAGAGAGLGAYDKGKAAFAAGDLRGAAEHFKKAFALEPEPVYLYSRASCHRRLGENALAAELYEEFLRLAPAGERREEREKAVAYAADLRLQLGIDLRTRGDCTGALAELRRSLEHVPRASAWLHTGMCKEDLGDREGARTAYERTLAAGDLDASVRPAVELRLVALNGATATSPALEAPASSPSEPGAFSPVPLVVIGSAAAAVAVGVILAVVLTSGKAGGVDLPPADYGPFRIGGW